MTPTTRTAPGKLANVAARIQALPACQTRLTVPQRTLEAALASGRARRTLPGRFVAVPQGLDKIDKFAQQGFWEGARISAALHTLRGNETLSHSSAAYLWGFPNLVRDGLVHVTTQNGKNRRRKGHRIHQLHLPDAHRERVLEVSLTDLPRTAIDLASICRPGLGLAALDFARGEGVSIRELEERVDAAHLRNSNRLLRLIAQSVANSDSVPESEARYWLIAAGIGAVHTQYRVATRSGTFYLDAAIPELKLACEYDGESKYNSREDLLREKRREDAIRELGWDFIRLTARDLRAPDQLVRVLRARAERRRGR
ncbi:hypothetical protein [Timonella senegalensis]|uniref:hypothetical protein n=1 Tax=Timonella senegalensis TaxID=1465825 RepID=UPI0028AD004C|nr:hypothetical protein [Timonella senegalensis]